ncbi:hypothetical protein GCM10009679_21650 [Saccharothrix algeriensis]|uniref:Uncharacterized protein n=1 Tax=Catellatospora bangladeshensis TaxID=310355 RepID=A0A8J3JBT2_9ACTN|nr:hypothetical protein Cba03nite_33110 [Catellatospora bangladeshensis]
MQLVIHRVIGYGLSAVLLVAVSALLVADLMREENAGRRIGLVFYLVMAVVAMVACAVAATRAWRRMRTK